MIKEMISSVLEEDSTAVAAGGGASIYGFSVHPYVGYFFLFWIGLFIVCRGISSAIKAYRDVSGDNRRFGRRKTDKVLEDDRT